MIFQAEYTLVFVLSLVYRGVQFQVNDDKILSLPGLDYNITFNQYSGYLGGQLPSVQIHYWFVEAAFNSSKLPLVLWLNGGPGCSSLLGLLTENGPFRVANVLYFEAPAGVGFSYAEDGNVKTDDDEVAANNFAALLNFFMRFPEYKGREFYITGESYGGVYVPTLALLVAKRQELNLKGIAVGNGLLSYLLNDNSLIYFAYHHGILGERLWGNLLEACCSRSRDTHCLFTLNPDIKCKVYVKEFSDIINYGLNIYNLYAPCAGGIKLQTDSIHRHKATRRLAALSNLFRSNEYVQMTNEYTQRDQKILPCSDDQYLEDYLNDPDVRQALHIPDRVGPWTSCSESVLTQYGRTYLEMSSQYLELLHQKIEILVYNGDVDMACNFLGDEWFLNNLSLPLINPRSAWIYNDVDKTTQIGGYSKTFYLPATKTKLTYATVRGSGHMVPEDKPIQGFTLFRNFLHSLL